MYYLIELVKKPLTSITTCFCLATWLALFPATGHAAQPCATPQFPQWESFDAGTQPVAIVKADFNADGKPDVAAANNFSSEVSFLAGDGNGGFSAPVTFSVPEHPVAIATADFNKDGRADLAVAGYTDIQGSGSVSVLLGNGSGGFGAPVSFTVGQGPSSIVTGDFNNDGKTDLAVGIQLTDTVSVVFGDGLGGFSGAISINSGGTPRALAAADLNGDGKLDLVAANGSNNVSVFLNNGAGGFGSATNFTVGADHGAIAVGDFNGDHKLDLVVANQSSTTLQGSVSVLLGDGAGGFGAPANYDVGVSPRGIVVADFDRDGKADLAVANYFSHNVSILIGDGAGHFTTGVGYIAGRGPESLAAGDFNLDGKIDLATSDTVWNKLVLLAGKGDGRFSTPATYAAGNTPSSVATGDFNGDGKADAAVANFSFNPSTVSLLLGDGRGGLRLTQSFGVGADPRSLTAADFNGDGKLDLATVNRADGTVSVLIGNGSGSFAAARTFSTGSNVISVAMRAGDFNGDGRVDLAVANTVSAGPNATVSILLGDGAGNFGAATQFSTGGANAVDVAPGDFNGDSKTDLLVANGGTSAESMLGIALLVGNGTGNFAAPVTFGVGSSPRSIAVGDFNGDNRLDAAVANRNSGAPSSTVSILLNNGAGGFATAKDVAAGPELDQVVSADVNADGKLDLITKSNTFEILILQGDGAGNFSPAQTIAFDYGSVATGDLDGDSLPDIVATGPSLLAVFLNGCGAGAPNPVDDSAFFVRQHYLDFLDREPDTSGLAFWTNQIESCGSDAQCREAKRIHVSAAFFLSIEFQETGYLAYRAHKVAFGNIQGKPVPITRDEMLADMRIIGSGVIVNAQGWEQKLEQNKRDYFDQLAASSRFTALYPQTLTPEQYVDALNSNAGGALSQAERDTLVSELKGGSKTRAQALRTVAEDSDLSKAEFNKAFVLMQYFGYLRRNPDDLPDHDFGGWQFWLNKLNEFNGDFIQAEMVKAFLSSDEYRNRFGR
jgi:hypothetical protein